LTDRCGTGSPLGAVQSAEPWSPLEASTVIPVIAAISSAPSVALIPRDPIAPATAGSHNPSDAEITCGLR
jgi:hypothetical protein